MVLRGQQMAVLRHRLFPDDHNPVEVANNIRKNGGTILGYRPGKPTADYIKKVLNRITLIGALFLGFIAVFPIVLSMTGNAVFQAFAFGGSSLLIVVVVTMDFMSQVQAYMMSHQYENLLKKTNFKGFGSGL